MTKEMVDVVDENNNIIDTVSKKEAITKNLRYKAVYFLIFNSKKELLITKRSSNMIVDPSLYEIPAGTVKSKESFEDCAYREIKEELGIEKIELKHLFDINYNKIKKKNMRVYSCCYDGIITPQKEEIESFKFIPIKELKKEIKENKNKFAKSRIIILEKYLGEKII